MSTPSPISTPTSLKSQLETDKLELGKEFDHITAKKNALDLKQKDIAESLGKAQKNTGAGVKNPHQALSKNEDYIKASKEYDKLAQEKNAIYEKQLAANEKANEIKAKNDLISKAEKQVADDKVTSLKGEYAEEEEKLERLKASKAKVDTDGENKHEKAYDHAIAQSQKNLDNKAAEIAAAEKASVEANELADKQKTENAQAVAESCPEICGATKLTVLGDSKTRAVLLDVSPGQSNKILNVISASKAGLDKNIVDPPVEIISAYMEGHCDKGKPSVSPNSGSADKYERDETDAHCPSMSVKKGITNIGMPGTVDSPLKFRAFCPDPPNSTISDWGYLLSNVFMPEKSEFNTYVIESKGCDGSYPLTATVRTFPKIKASIDLGVTYNYIKNEKDIPKLDSVPVKTTEILEAEDNKQEGKKVIHIDNWDISVNLKGQADHIALGAQLQILDPSELLKGLRESVTIFLYLFDLILMDAETATDLAFGGKKIGESVADTDASGKKWDKSSSGGTGKIGIRYPKLGLSLAYENTETDGNTTLDYKMTAEFKADPLIGIGMEINVLSALVKIGMNSLLPGSPTVLEKGKQFAEFIWDIMNDVTEKDKAATKDNIEDRDFYLEAGLSIVMKLGASLGCGAKWERDFGEADGKVVEDPTTKKGNYSAAANASLDFILEGKAYVKGNLLMVKFEAGLMIALGSAKSADIAKLEFKLELIGVGGKPTVTGGVEWTGLAIIFASYWEAGLKHKDNANESKSKGSGFGKSPTKGQTESNLKSMKNKTHHQWVLIEPGKYPEDKEIALDKYAKL